MSEAGALPSVDAVLDKVAVKTCEELLDDVPARDPRWEVPEGQVALGSSYSMQVAHQLGDKQKALNLYLGFLHEAGLWGRLCACTYRDIPLATVYILGELSEKLVAALALKNIAANPLLENAIGRATEAEIAEMEYRLSHQDVFYREVTRVHRVMKELAACCEEAAHSDLNPKEVAGTIVDANDVMLVIF